MQDILKKRAGELKLLKNIEVAEMGVAELDPEPAGSYDVIMSGLCLSELSAEELRYTLREAKEY